MTVADRILNHPRVRRSDGLRTFFTAAWLGWQIESNWAKPALFAAYIIVRPLSLALIIVVMYSVITDTAATDPTFAYVYIGNALYILVSSILAGISWAVIDDREHYRTNKQLHTTPMNGYAYLLGRGAARVLLGTISLLVVLLFGIVAFSLPITLLGTDWVLLTLSTIIGIVGMAGMGVILAAFTMQMARYFIIVGEGVAAALFLFTGAIFPLEVLPVFLRWIGYLLPPTYWMELCRRALLGNDAASFDTFAAWTNEGLLAALSVLCLAIAAFSVYFYRWSLYQAKEKGIIDMDSTY